MLFDAEHVAKCLGFRQFKNYKQYVRWETINKLAFIASNETAERFQEWLAIDVIPSIRKHDAYMTPHTIEQVLLDPYTISKI
ncbi:BRO-N domain-containing protein [Viridibacillus arvi]|uniref:hypothetical protein n=1 Tax=Viridibacillus arvi TaxID=263475 RepID=UPI0036E7B879